MAWALAVVAFVGPVEAQRGRSRRAPPPAEQPDEPAEEQPAPRFRTVLCCDGSRSPTCGCDRASLRGCCSRHGGVCGDCDAE